jgi:hypothetical protein
MRSTSAAAHGKLVSMTGWSDAEIGEATVVCLLVGLVLAHGVVCWRALYRTPRSTTLPAEGWLQRVPLDAYLWFGLAGAQWAMMRSGWLPNASPLLPLIGIVMGLGTLVRRTLEARAKRNLRFRSGMLKGDSGS